MKKNIYIIGLAIGLFACSPTKLITKKTNIKDSAIEVAQTNLLIRPFLADLDIQADRKTITYLGPLNLSQTDLKNNARQEFLETFGADYIVDPIYSIVTTEENRKLSLITIKLTGFAATYKKIYQVDSLPKSIIQHASINKNTIQLEYTNSIEETQLKKGLEASFGNFNGIQFDILSNNVKNNHFYLASEILNSNLTGYTGDLYTHTDTTISKKFDNKINQLNLSLGFYKSISVFNKLSLRILGGVNYSMFSFENYNDVNKYYQISSLGSGGFRLGTGFDYKLHKNIFLVGKVNTNIGLYTKVFYKELLSNSADHQIDLTNVKISGAQNTTYGIGLRIIF